MLNNLKEVNYMITSLIAIRNFAYVVWSSSKVMRTLLHRYDGGGADCFHFIISFCTFFPDVGQIKTSEHSCFVLCKIQNHTAWFPILRSVFQVSTLFTSPTSAAISHWGGIWEALKIFQVPVRQGGGNKREEGKGPGWGFAHGGAVRFQLHHARHSLHDQADHSSLESHKCWILYVRKAWKTKLSMKTKPTVLMYIYTCT